MAEVTEFFSDFVEGAPVATTGEGKIPIVQLGVTRALSLSTIAAGNLSGDVTGPYVATVVSRIGGQTVVGTTGSGNVVFSDSPALTGVPIAPTAAGGTNTTQIATTAFVAAMGSTGAAALAAETSARQSADTTLQTNINNEASARAAADALLAPKASPVFTGNPTAPTPPPGDNDTSLATTAFVTAAVPVPALPTAVAGDLPVSGSAPTFMRSDAAPAVQKASSTVFGLAKVDGTTITATGGVLTSISAGGGITALTNDVLAGPGSGSQVATLVTVNANVGTFQGLTLDGKGRVTAAVNQNYLTTTAASTTYAPINAPVFTGDARAVTPATADNDTSIATTAYVQAQGYATTAAMGVADNLRVLKSGDTMTGNLIVNPGNVGIGTAAPGAKLEVNGAIKFTGATGTLNASLSQLGNYTVVYAPDAGTSAQSCLMVGATADPAIYYRNTTHQFQTRDGTVTRMIIDTSGNVGIGTAAPASTLTVAGGVAQFTGSTSPTTGAGLEVGYGGIANTGHITSYNRTGATFSDFLVNSAKTIFWIGGVEKVRIDTTGNVGIGTATPGGAKLSVHAATDQNFVVSSTAAGALIGSINDANATWQPLEVSPFASAYLCSSGGNVGIGTTGPGALLDVRKQSAAGAIVGVFRTGPNGADTTSTMLIFQDYGQTVSIGAITRNGTNTVAYGTTSDARLKSDITGSNRGLDALMQIKVSDYDMGETHQQGLLAQDVAKVYPEAVFVGGDDPQLQPWMIDYGRLTPLLIRTIQQQQDQIASLEERLASLEGAR